MGVVFLEAFPYLVSQSLCGQVTVSLKGLTLNQSLNSKLQIPPNLGGKIVSENSPGFQEFPQIWGKMGLHFCVFAKLSQAPAKQG